MIRYLRFLGKVTIISQLFAIFYLVSINPVFGNESSSIIATVGISICGNGEIEGGEICDIFNLNNFSCKDFGYEYGELKCSISCDEYDVTNCSHSQEEISSQEVVILEQKIIEEVNLEEEKESNMIDEIVFQEIESSIKDREDAILLNSDNISDNELPLDNSINDQTEYFEYNNIDIDHDFISRSPP